MICHLLLVTSRAYLQLLELILHAVCTLQYVLSYVMCAVYKGNANIQWHTVTVNCKALAEVAVVVLGYFPY